MIAWLDEDEPPRFPPVERALGDPNGLLAAGGRLTPEWLLAAYQKGIFPWYSGGEPILWWSLDPRLVLAPSAIRITRSLRRTLRSGRFDIRFDTAFAQVIACCAEPRDGQPGTWITPAIQQAYGELHQLGYAHSVEAWHNGALVGGLYGVALGKAFFGESMFSRMNDASKCCLAYLARHLETEGFELIDCQMTTPHLVSMGAVEISRKAFSNALTVLTACASPATKWPETPVFCF